MKMKMKIKMKMKKGDFPRGVFALPGKGKKGEGCPFFIFTFIFILIKDRRYFHFDFLRYFLVDYPWDVDVMFVEEDGESGFQF